MDAAPTAGACFPMSLRLKLRVPAWGKTHQERWFDVRFRKNLMHEGELHDGLTDYETQVIRVRTDDHEAMVDTLYHESFHNACPDLDEDTIRRLTFNAMQVRAAERMDGWPGPRSPRNPR